MNDLHPIRLKMANFYCYRGEQEVNLGGNVYAVVAQAEDNPERSNWLGKTTLLTAFAFMLFGWHTKATLDDIVTTGEQEMTGELELSDGTLIRRAKARGASMKVRVTLPDGRELAQSDAQSAIATHIGFTEDDWMATCFFRQKRIGELVSARASERSTIIEGWLAEELLAVQKLHGAAAADLAAVSRQIEERSAVVKSATETLVELLEGDLSDARIGEVTEELDDATLSTGDQRKSAQAALERALKTVEAYEAARRRQASQEATRAELTRLEERGRALKAEHAKAEAAAKKAGGAERTAADEAAVAGAKLRELKVTLDAMRSNAIAFDGVCPVNRRQCPSADWVCAESVSEEAVKKVSGEVRSLRDTIDELEQKGREARATIAHEAKLARELSAMRADAMALAERASGGEELDVDEEELDAAQALIDESRAKVERCNADLVEIGTMKRRLQDAAAVWRSSAKDVEALEARRAVVLEAATLTGRSGAQQAIQELAMADIKRIANEMLATAEIPLQVNVTWEEESGTPAKVCPECGTAFPTSRKVKECVACGAARGNAVQRRLNIEPTNRSGAAEDLAGVALGIAASRWLRHQRGSRWSSVFIDEPFGALDAHNRAAFSAHIVQMLKSSFASGFVVAHERAVLAAMPARIDIVAGPTGSRIAGTTE